MKCVQLLLLCTVIHLAHVQAWNQPRETTNCYSRQTGCSPSDLQHQLLRDNILLVQQNLEKDIQALHTMLETCSEKNSTQCTCNQTENGLVEELRVEVAALKENIQMITESLQQQEIVTEVVNILSEKGSILNPANSCEEIASENPGEYWIKNSNTNIPTKKYCNTSKPCGNATREWSRVGFLDMTDPTQECPGELRLLTRSQPPLRMCGRASSTGCVSVTFPVNGIEYSQVYGRIVAFQSGTPDAFLSYYSNRAATIDDNYVDGVSLTYGQSPRKHIWTFAGALHEYNSHIANTCPCTRTDLPFTGVVPPFIGQDYFCETASRNNHQFIFYPNDPLWDGIGCADTSTCCTFNNPPWFCKQLPEPTTDNIELRLCMSESFSNEDIPIEIIEMYVQ